MSRRKKVNKDRLSAAANTGPNESEGPRLPNQDRSDEHSRQQERRLLTVLFCERELQKTLSLDASTTISEAKELGSHQLLDHLRRQPDAPPDLSIDDECTDFFPAPSDDTITMGDLVKHTAFMILWPKPLPGTSTTPSPYMDELKHKSSELKLQAAELKEARSKLNTYQLLELEEKSSHQTKQQGKGRKPAGSIHTPPTHVIDEAGLSMASILGRFAAMEERLVTVQESNTELRDRLTIVEESNMELQESNMELQESNAKLRVELQESHDRLEATMQTTMEAVLGDRIAINKIRNRVLLDSARNQLAVICGCRDWWDWKSRADRDTMFFSALTQLQNGDDISDRWRALCSRPTALKLLIFRNVVRSRGDLAAHVSAQKHIAESVLGLAGVNEREDMCVIFAAVFGVEPVMDAAVAHS